MLVVDGNASLASVLAELLDDEDGFRVIGTAVTGEQALGLAQDAEADVVLVDERLDDALTTAVLEGLRIRCPHALLLVWSHDRVHTVSEHADGVLERGMAFREVVQAICRALRGRCVSAR